MIDMVLRNRVLCIPFSTIVRSIVFISLFVNNIQKVSFIIKLFYVVSFYGISLFLFGIAFTLTSITLCLFSVYFFK